MFSWENTYKELADGRPEIALLPVGAIEQHSTHLPLGTDWLIAKHLARLVAERLDAFLLPALPISNSQEHQDFMGTLWIGPATLAAVITDICAALKHHGFRKIVVLSGHGGNWIIKPTVRHINLNDPEMMVIMAGPGTAGASSSSKAKNIHAGMVETSLIMHLHPELVKGKGEDFQPEVPQGYMDYVGIKGCTPTGTWGSPSKASVETGQKIVAEMVEGIVAYTRKTFDYIEQTRRNS